jgi:FkbM family methyltransferase
MNLPPSEQKTLEAIIQQAREWNNRTSLLDTSSSEAKRLSWLKQIILRISRLFMAPQSEVNERVLRSLSLLTEEIAQSKSNQTVLIDRIERLQHELGQIQINQQKIQFSHRLPERILIVSHKQKRCGVYQYGVNIAETLKKSTKYSFIYAECSTPEELITIAAIVNPLAIIYNYHPATLPWLQKELIKKINKLSIGIIHEVTQQTADCLSNELFQYHIAGDPTLLLNNPILFKTNRLIPLYPAIHEPPKLLTIGSFGFGLEGKGFERLLSTVQDEFDEAIVRLHIPISDFADPEGHQAEATAKRCQELIIKPGIKLILTHEFLGHEQMLDFLGQNTINAFFYERYEGRGISSVIDYALAVKRPIALTKSTMFRHMFSALPAIFIEDTSLQQIIENGITPLIPYYSAWNESNFIADYERILDQVLNKQQISSPSNIEQSTPLIADFSIVERNVKPEDITLPINQKLSFFQTATGDYFLPTDVTTDVIINDIKAGRVFEAEILEAAKEYITEGSTVLDVGASFGQMTILFSEFVGNRGWVFSFEADNLTFWLLEKNIAANNRRNIISIGKAVYDKSDRQMFYPLPDFKRFGSYGSYGLDPNAQEGRKVETIAIDDLNIQTPISFMKVDTQGSDLFVLRGAVETIKKYQMPIIFEYEKQFDREFNTSLDDYLEFIDSISYRVEKIINSINFLIVPKRSPYMGISNVTLFNRILDDAARYQYAPVIDKLFKLVPDMMARKIPEANIQQAFVLDSVLKFASKLADPKILCVGSFEDTAAAGLKKLGYQIEEIDPVLNYSLDQYFYLPSTIKGSYDIIFSTSVLEHVQNDEIFVTQIAELLASGGTAILTCDYNDQYQLGDPIPQEDIRFYTQKDFTQRLLPLLNNCSCADTPQWDCPNPDFTYGGCHYTFATLVFQKTK